MPIISAIKIHPNSRRVTSTKPSATPDLFQSPDGGAWLKIPNDGLLNPSVHPLEDAFQKILILVQLYGFKPGKLPTFPPYWEQFKDNWMPFLKYKLAAYAACALGQAELPKRPKFLPEMDKAEILVGSKIGRFLRFLKSQSTTSPTSQDNFYGFVNSVLNLKKAFVLPSDQQVEESVSDTFQDLTREDRTTPAPSFFVDWGDSEGKFQYEPLLSSKTVKVQIKRTVEEIFGGVSYTNRDRIRPFVPSFRANYVRTRSKFGTFGEIATDSWFQDFKELHKEEIISALKVLDLDESGVYGPRSDNPNRTEFDDLFGRFYAALGEQVQMELDSQVPPPVQLVGLKEPLKVRTISKGPPKIYAFLKPLQKFMFGVLKVHPCFQLIGKPIDSRTLHMVLGSSKRGLEFLLSGDYSRATNLIFSRWSDAVVEAICDSLGLSALERRCFHLALTGHTVEYTDSQGVTYSALQRKGQLMGSIVSFPVLCILNACLCRWAMEVDQKRRLSLRRCPLLINGDDCVLRGSNQLIQKWRKVIRYFGFEESVGKCYFSQDFLVMNSELFSVRTSYFVSWSYWYGNSIHRIKTLESVFNIKEILRARKFGWEEGDPELDVDAISEDWRLIEFIEFLGNLPFIPELPVDRVDRMALFYQKLTVDQVVFTRCRSVNLGLACGRSDWTDQDATLLDAISSADSIGARCRSLVNLAPNHLRDPLIFLFINTNRKLLTGPYLRELPWFIPETLGGVGLPRGSSPDLQPSDLDLRLARSILHFGGVSVPILPTEILLSTYVNNRLGTISFSRYPNPDLDVLKGLLYASGLFVQPFESLTKANVRTYDVVREALRKNSRLWARFRKKGIFFHGKYRFGIENLSFECLEDRFGYTRNYQFTDGGALQQLEEACQR